MRKNSNKLLRNKTKKRYSINNTKRRANKTKKKSRRKRRSEKKVRLMAGGAAAGSHTVKGKKKKQSLDEIADNILNESPLFKGATENIKELMRLILHDETLRWNIHGKDELGSNYIYLKEDPNIHFHLFDNSGTLYIQLTARCEDERQGNKCQREFMRDRSRAQTGHRARRSAAPVVQQISGCHFRQNAYNAISHIVSRNSSGVVTNVNVNSDRFKIGLNNFISQVGGVDVALERLKEMLLAHKRDACTEEWCYTTDCKGNIIPEREQEYKRILEEKMQDEAHAGTQSTQKEMEMMIGESKGKSKQWGQPTAADTSAAAGTSTQSYFHGEDEDEASVPDSWENL